MSKVYETLKKKDDPTVEVYPNIESDNIPTGAITTSKIPTGAITTDKIADGNVNTSKIADNSITTPKIVSSAITTDKINSKAVTEDKLSDDVTDKLNRKLYSHHVNIRVTINSIVYHFYINIISTKNNLYDYGSLWNYMYVQGHEMVYALMVEGEGYLDAWDEDISVSISSKNGDKLNPAINIDLSNADSYDIIDKIIEIY